MYQNGLISNHKQSSFLQSNIDSSRHDIAGVNSIDDDLFIDNDLESFNLSPKSRSETRLERRSNIASSSSFDKSNDLNDNPLAHIFGSSSPIEPVKHEGRRRRSSLWGDEPERLDSQLTASSSSSSRLFSVKANVNRYRSESGENEPENETIPFIPDIDDIDESSGKIPDELPNFTISKLISLQELEKDITKHQAFSNLAGTDSSILGSRIISQAQVKEDDVPWTWDSLISEISSFIDQNIDQPQ